MRKKQENLREEMLSDRSARDLLVLGGPGSGKTTVGLLKARSRVQEGLEEGQKVLFLSFSNSAVYQILSFSNSAVYQIQTAAGMQLSPEERGGIQVRTFHSACFELLKSYGGLLGLKVPLTIFPPEDEALLEARYKMDAKRFVAERLRNAKIEGMVSFDLLISLSAELLSRSQRVRRVLQSRFPLVIVDEFQDTDEEQWKFIGLLTEGIQLVCLADPLQRIFDFRKGVTERRIDDFRKARNPEVIDLGQDNHRSPT